MEVPDHARHLTSKFWRSVREELSRNPLRNNIMFWPRRVAIATQASLLNDVLWKRALPARVGIGQNEVVNPLGVEPIELLGEHAAPPEINKVCSSETGGIEKPG